MSAVDDKAAIDERMKRLEKLHAVMLGMLDDFQAICREHSLCWFAAFGTAIGAVREKGFIPWDDDIDLCMPREDAERLAVIVREEWSEKYEILNAEVNARYPMATTRLMLKGTEFRDRHLLNTGFESGIFLDIFPLDDLADDERAYRRQAWRAWLFNKLAIARDIPDPYVAAHGAAGVVLRTGARVMHTCLNLPAVRGIAWSRLSLKYQTAFRGKKTRRVGFLCETDRFSCTWDRDDLYPTKTVEFEGREIPVAGSCEKLLAEMYGDYMTPPPVSERFGHFPDLLDFGKYE